MVTGVNPGLRISGGPSGKKILEAAFTTPLRIRWPQDLFAKFSSLPRTADVFSGNKCEGTFRMSYLGLLILNEKHHPQDERSAVTWVKCGILDFEA